MCLLHWARYMNFWPKWPFSWSNFRDLFIPGTFCSNVINDNIGSKKRITKDLAIHWRVQLPVFCICKFSLMEIVQIVADFSCGCQHCCLGQWSVAWLTHCCWLEGRFLQKNFNLGRWDYCNQTVQQTVFDTSGHDRNNEECFQSFWFTLAGSGLTLLLILASSSTLAWYFAWENNPCWELDLCPPCTGADTSLCLYFNFTVLENIKKSDPCYLQRVEASLDAAFKLQSLLHFLNLVLQPSQLGL